MSDENYIARKTDEVIMSYSNSGIGTSHEKYSWEMEVVGDDDAWFEMSVDADSFQDILNDIETDIDYEEGLEREKR